MFKERVREALPDGRRAAATLLDALARPNQADLDEFRRGIDPLASSGKLGALLAQFPPSFKDSAGVTRLSRLAARARSRTIRVAVELRHRSWSDAVGDTLALLNAFGAAWVQIDEPKFRFSIRQNYLPNVDGFYYMRLHGRNATQWWTHEKSEDRYNYLYSGGRAQRVRRDRRTPRGAREEAVPLHEQPLLGEVGRQRGDDQEAARRAARTASIRRNSSSVSGAEASSRPLPAHSFTYIRRDQIAALQLRREPRRRR